MPMGLGRRRTSVTNCMISYLVESAMKHAKIYTMGREFSTTFPHKKGAPRRAPLSNIELRLGRADVIRPWSLLALLDVEADGLATTQAVEVQRGVHTTLMEEVFLAIVGGDEPKSAVGHDLLYGAFWHCPFSSSRTPN